MFEYVAEIVQTHNTGIAPIRISTTSSAMSLWQILNYLAQQGINLNNLSVVAVKASAELYEIVNHTISSSSECRIARVYLEETSKY